MQYLVLYSENAMGLRGENSLDASGERAILDAVKNNLGINKDMMQESRHVLSKNRNQTRSALHTKRDEESVREGRALHLRKEVRYVVLFGFATVITNSVSNSRYFGVLFGFATTITNIVVVVTEG